MSSQPSLLAALHPLLEEPSDKRSLACRVTGACILLSTPTLHTLAFHTITTGYHQLLAQYEQGNSGVDRDLEASLDGARSVLHSVFAYCPRGWSVKILKWIVGLYGQLCACRQPYATLGEGMKAWLVHPVLRSVSGLINKCTDYLVSMGLGKLCVETVLPICLARSPHLDWMLAHVISLHPVPLVPVLLTHSLPSQPTATLSKTIEFLSKTHCDAVRSGAVRIIHEEVLGWREGGLGVKLLLRLAVLSQPFLEAVSAACLEIVSPAKIQALVVSRGDGVPSTSRLRDNHTTEQDEGEVLSSDDDDSDEARELPESADFSAEMVEKLGKIICQMNGRDASVAISHIIQVYREMSRCQRNEEEAMEEGEIVHVSPVQGVMNGCEGVMAHVLHRLHTASQHHLSPAGVGGGDGAVEFAVSLQAWLEQLCQLLTERDQDPTCAQWLEEVITSVCTCTSELQAARTLLLLLTSPILRNKITAVGPLYWRLRSRHPTVARTTIAMTTILCKDKQQVFYQNLKSLLQIELSTPCCRQIYSDFTRGLSAHFKLLSLSLASGMQLLPVPSLHRLSLLDQCQVGWHTLTHFFTLLRKVSSHLMDTGEVDIFLEFSAGQCQHSLVHHSSSSEEAAVFLCHSTLSTLLSQERHSQPRPTAAPGDVLLPANNRLAVSTTYGQKFNTIELHHSGKLQSRKRSKLSHQLELLSMVHRSNLAVQLLTNMTPPSVAQLASVMLDLVAPRAQPGMIVWPDEEVLKYCLEWDLSVYRNCADHPVVWHVFDLIAEDPAGLVVCASALRSLLTVLAQHWQRCRAKVATACPQELANSISLVHCMAKAKWIPPPLAFGGELFELAAPYELYQILSAVYTYLKENFAVITSTDRSGHGQLTDTGFREVLRGIMVKNIQKFGHLYARFMLC